MGINLLVVLVFYSQPTQHNTTWQTCMTKQKLAKSMFNLKCNKTPVLLKHKKKQAKQAKKKDNANVIFKSIAKPA